MTSQSKIKIYWKTDILMNVRVRRILYGITRQKKVIKAEEASKYHSRTLGNRITHHECGNQGSSNVMNGGDERSNWDRGAEIRCWQICGLPTPKDTLTSKDQAVQSHCTLCICNKPSVSLLHHPAAGYTTMITGCGHIQDWHPWQT